MEMTQTCVLALMTNMTPKNRHTSFPEKAISHVVSSVVTIMYILEFFSLKPHNFAKKVNEIVWAIGFRHSWAR